MSEIYKKKGDVDNAKKVMADARAKYPKDVELLRGEVNFLLNDQLYDKAVDLLKSLAASDPNNETVWFVLGATHEKLGNLAEQEKAYKQAVDLKPNYFDALFNLGATYYNEGVEKMKECDKIPPREAAKYDDCVAKTKVSFAKSIEYLERAFEEKKEDQDIINALSEAYLRVDNMDGHKKMKDLMNSKGSKLQIGMNSSEVLKAIGDPIKKSESIDASGKTEQWIYENNFYVILKNGKVQSWHTQTY